jgi:hypothetical protein
LEAGSWQEAIQADRKSAFLSSLFPDRAGYSPRMEVPDRRVNRCDAGVSGEVAGGPEAAGVADGQEYGGGGRDADSRHGHQDPGKREVVQELFDFLGHDGPLVFESGDARQRPTARRVCGIAGAVSAMMNASRASVLGFPGYRSAALRIARPGR